MQILKATGIDWHETRMITRWYMYQCVRVRLDQEETRSVKTGREVRQECCLSPILFNLYGEYSIHEALNGFGDFRTGGQVIRTVKYVDDLVLVAKKETVLQNTIDRLIEIERCYGMEMNVRAEKTKVMKISREPSPVEIMKIRNNSRMYTWGSVTSGARCACKIMKIRNNS